MASFIPGIYHYCTGFCPACAFQQRCEVFAETSRLQRGKDLPDPASPHFDQYMRVHIVPVVESIDVLFKARWPSVPRLAGLTAEEQQELEARIAQWVNTHPLLLAYTNYQNRVHGFLKQETPLLELVRRLRHELRMGLISRDLLRNRMKTVQEALTQIYWNHELIKSKIHRALLGKHLVQQQLQSDLSDSNGTAKTALLAIRITMESWTIIYTSLPMLEDIALPVLSILERLVHQMQLTFPQAMSFKRPGFDD